MKNNIYFVFLGLLFVSYIVYNRLFRNRIPFDFTNYISTTKLIIYIILIMSSICLFVIYIINLYKFLKKIDRESILSVYFNTIYQHKYNPLLYLQESLTDLDAFIKNNAPLYDNRRTYIDVIILNISLFLCKYYRIFFVIILLIRIIPQVLVCFCFTYDIVYNEHFIYFYKSLFLLILPLIVKYILHSIKTLVDCNLEVLNEVLDLSIVARNSFQGKLLEVPEENFQKINVYIWADLLQVAQKDEYYCRNKLSPEYVQKTIEESEELLIFSVNNMHNFFNIRTFLQQYKTYAIYIEYPFNILKCGVYILGWLFLCLKGLHIF